VRIVISHNTMYRYDHPIRFSAQYLRLTPRTNASQRVVRWTVEGDGRLTPWTDGFGNVCHTMVCDEEVEQVTVTASGIIETTEVTGVLPDEGVIPLKVFLRSTALTEPSASIREFVAPLETMARDNPLECAHALSQAIVERVVYEEGTTHVASTAADALKHGRGVCQDMAHLYIASARALGMPARYVSGYLYTGDEHVPAVASHAWASVWVDSLGWVSFDLANRTCGTERHVGLAYALDYTGAAPVRGIRQGGSNEVLDVQVMVTTQMQA
jgi:transglutaminase-like putative cysteine protease